MPPNIRPAKPSDLGPLAALLARDAEQRAASDPDLWRLADRAVQQIETALSAVLGTATPPFRQSFLHAETEGRLLGLTHSLHLPVPPIYAGPFGEPGLLREDCLTTPDAPEGTALALLVATESGLRAAGARLLLAAALPGSDWQNTLAAAGYAPLTLYLAKSGLRGQASDADTRPAGEADLPTIGRQSAAHRQTLAALNPFWATHPEADQRFAAWMRHSLTLSDRDMRVAGPSATEGGYIIAQPATPLHFPAGHEIGHIGIIDDFYSPDFADPVALTKDGAAAVALLKAAETALAARGRDTALVVCPADWGSKRALLEQQGYRTGLVWMIRPPG